MLDWTDEEYAQAERAIGYAFRDRALLLTCFTHASYANQHGGKDNERLEFLGDAVLELAVTEALYRNTEYSEGELTELRKRFVSKNALNAAAEKAGLMRFLRYEGGENNISGKTPSNLFEAVVAGVYLDGGLDAARKFLGNHLVFAGGENYKTLLQEYVQERTKSTPVYSTREEEGAFSCKVRALGAEASGRGASKKEAETAAAEALLRILNERKP